MTDPAYPPNLTDRVVVARALVVARKVIAELPVDERDQLDKALDDGGFPIRGRRGRRDAGAAPDRRRPAALFDTPRAASPRADSAE